MASKKYKILVRYRRASGRLIVLGNRDVGGKHDVHEEGDVMKKSTHHEMVTAFRQGHCLQIEQLVKYTTMYEILCF